MYGAELKPNVTVTIDPPPDEHVRLTNAVLVKRPKSKNARVIVQVGDPASSEVQVAFAVLTQAADNVPLDVVINSPMELRIVGNGIAGAIVHVTGSEEDLIELHGDETGMQFPTELVDMNQLFADGQGAQIFGDLGDDSDDDDYEQDGGADEDADGSDDDSDSDSDADSGGGGGDGEDEDDEEVDLVAEIETDRSLVDDEPSRKRRTRNSNGARTTGANGDNDKNDESEEAQAGPPAKRAKGDTGNGAQETAVVKRGKGTLPLREHRTGLKYRDVVMGVGKRVQRGHFVALQYTLRLENGKVVDKAERKRPFKFRVGIGECVKGFDIGVMGMREGGERHLIVPPDLGYGSQNLPGIPAGSTLYFDVSVVKAF